MLRNYKNQTQYWNMPSCRRCRAHGYSLPDRYVLSHPYPERASIPCGVLISRLTHLTKNMPNPIHHTTVIIIIIILVLSLDSRIPTAQAAPVDRTILEEYAVHCDQRVSRESEGLDTRTEGLARTFSGQIFDESPLDRTLCPFDLKDPVRIAKLKRRKPVALRGFFDWSKAGQICWAIFGFFTTTVAATFLFWGEIPRLPPARKNFVQPLVQADTHFCA